MPSKKKQPPKRTKQPARPKRAPRAPAARLRYGPKGLRRKAGAHAPAVSAFHPANFGIPSISPEPPSCKFSDMAMFTLTGTASDASGTYQRVTGLMVDPYVSSVAARRLTFAPTNYTYDVQGYLYLTNNVLDPTQLIPAETTGIGAVGGNASHYTSATMRRVCTTLRLMYVGRQDMLSGTVVVAHIPGLGGTFNGVAGRDGLVSQFVQAANAQVYPLSQFVTEQEIHVPVHNISTMRDYVYPRGGETPSPNVELPEWEGPAGPVFYTLGVWILDWDSALDAKALMRVQVRSKFELLPETSHVLSQTVTPNKPVSIGRQQAHEKVVSSQDRAKPRAPVRARERVEYA